VLGRGLEVRGIQDGTTNTGFSEEYEWVFRTDFRWTYNYLEAGSEAIAGPHNVCSG